MSDQPEDIAAQRRPALEDRVTRVLFAAMVFLVPAPFFWLFVVWFIPLACTIPLFLSVLPVAPFSGDAAGRIVTASILALHVAVDAWLLYLAAALVCRLLFSFGSTRVANFGVAALIAIGVIASTFPIYGFPSMGDGNPEMMNVVRVYRLFVTGQPPKSRRR